jgi:hypothetical protein
MNHSDNPSGEKQSVFITEQTWAVIDSLLAGNQLLTAIKALRNMGLDFADAKMIVGGRFRDRYPGQCASYRNLGDED